MVLEQPPEKDVPLTDPFLDPREIYLRELFMPNRFSAHTLRKALGVSVSLFYILFFIIVARGMKIDMKTLETSFKNIIDIR